MDLKWYQRNIPEKFSANGKGGWARKTGGGSSLGPETTLRTQRSRDTQGCRVRWAYSSTGHWTLQLPPNLPCWEGLGMATRGRQSLSPVWGTSRAHLCHPLGTPKLVNELIQGVDGQLSAQCPNLGQQVLLQSLHPLQDAGAMRVPLWGAQGPCRAEGQGLLTIWPAHSPTHSETQPWALQDEEVPTSSGYRGRRGVGAEVWGSRHSPHLMLPL